MFSLPFVVITNHWQIMTESIWLLEGWIIISQHMIICFSFTPTWSLHDFQNLQCKLPIDIDFYHQTSVKDILLVKCLLDYSYTCFLYVELLICFNLIFMLLFSITFLRVARNSVTPNNSQPTQNNIITDNPQSCWENKMK